MQPIDELLAIEAIKRLKARYFRCFDTKDWEGWLDVFTDDVTLEFSVNVTGNEPDPAATLLEGKQAIADFVVPYTTPAQTVHQGHMPEIEILSDTEARGVWAMEDIVDHFDNVAHGFGHYHETYRKGPDGWRIASVRLTRLRISQSRRDRISL